MNYWVTTHWPRLVSEPINKPHEGIWVQDQKWDAIKRIAPGDLAFIYESRTGRNVVHHATGQQITIPRRMGREGVIAFVEISGPPNQPDDTQREQYTNGSSAWWRFHAPTRSLNSGGFIPRADLAALLGYAPNYPFRGFGDLNSGLKQISEDTFTQIRQMFLGSANEAEQQRTARAYAPRFGGTGEGAEHRALKERIAADPSGVLGEPDLRLWKREWQLETGDRVDVVLKDKFDRFVAVEVEVDCDGSEIAGPLQCMKYRAMISYFFDRPLEEVRCILAAHSIHPDVLERCTNHVIEAKSVARALKATGGAL